MFKFLLILILSISCVARGQDIKWIEKNKPAPFMGVLMPEERFRDYELAYQQRDYLQDKAYENMKICRESQPSDTFYLMALSFIGGLALGAVALSFTH